MRQLLLILLCRNVNEGGCILDDEAFGTARSLNRLHFVLRTFHDVLRDLQFCQGGMSKVLCLQTVNAISVLFLTLQWILWNRTIPTFIPLEQFCGLTFAASQSLVSIDSRFLLVETIRVLASKCIGFVPRSTALQLTNGNYKTLGGVPLTHRTKWRDLWFYSASP